MNALFGCRHWRLLLPTPRLRHEVPWLAVGRSMPVARKNPTHIVRAIRRASSYLDWNSLNHTVDGRNPAPPGTYKTLYLMGWCSLHLNWFSRQISGCHQRCTWPLWVGMPTIAGCVAAGLLVKSSTPSRCEKQNGEQNPRALAASNLHPRRETVARQNKNMA